MANVRARNWWDTLSRRALERHVELVRRAGMRESEERSDREDMEERAENARNVAR